MKKNMILSGAFVAMLCLFGISNVNAQEFFDVPDYCTHNDFPDVGNTIHGQGVGDSRDQQIARDRARSAALVELGEAIQPDVIGLINEFNDSKQTENISDEEINKVAKKSIERVIQMNVKNVKTVCEKTVGYKNEKGLLMYKCFQMIEYDRTEFLRAICARLKAERMLKAEADFDKAMQNLHNKFKNR